MSNLTRRGRPSIFNLRRDIDDALDEFTSPRALRREIDRLFGEELSPRSLWQAMDRLFDDFVSPTPLRRRISSLFEPFGDMPMALGSMRGGMSFVPDLELKEEGNEYLLKVDLPGVRPDDVRVSVDDNNILTIRGERREEESRREKGYEYTERSYGSFMRSIELPRGVEVGKIDADYRDGVLQLHIPKNEKAMAARQIPIRSREAGQLGGGGQRAQGMQGGAQGVQGGEAGREQPRVMGPNEGANAERRERTDANAR